MNSLGTRGIEVRRALGALLSVSCSLVVPRLSVAQERGSARANEWEAPLGCPGRAWAERRVRVLAGERAGLEHGLPLGVHIEGASARWRATLARTGAQGTATRVLEGRSCRAVSDAAVVLLAWAVREDHDVIARAAAPAAATIVPPGAIEAAPSDVPAAEPAVLRPVSPALGSDDATSAVAPESARVLAAPVSRAGELPGPSDVVVNIEAPSARPLESPVPGARAMRSRLAPRARYVLGLTGGLEFGPLPGVAGSVGVYAGLVRGNFRAEVSFTARPGAAAELQRPAEGRSVGGRFRAFSGAVTGCYEHALRPVEFGVCASFEAGGVLAEGFGAAENTSRTEPWLAGRVDAELRVPVGPSFALRAAAGVVVPVVRPEYELTGIGTVFQPSVLGGRGALSAEVRF